MRLHSLSAVAVLAVCLAHVLLGRELAHGAHLVQVRVGGRRPASVRESAHDG